MAEQKTKRVQFRIKKTDYRCVYDKAHKSNKNVSEYIRDLILEDCRRP